MFKFFIKLFNLFICVLPIINGDESVNYQEEIWNWFKELNENLDIFNALSAKYSWDMATGKGINDISKIIKLFLTKNLWKTKICSIEFNETYLTSTERRMLYLFCRGPNYTSKSAIEYLNLMERMSNIYNSELCLNDTLLMKLNLQNVSNDHCLRIEPDLERLMKRTDLKAYELKLIWSHWHNYVGPKMKGIYERFVELQNDAARANGYQDIGEVWREELEINNLEELVYKLYEDLKEMYVMLHAVVRHKLYKKYGKEIVKPFGPIPIHLLGNMWGQDWSSLITLLVDDHINLDERMLKKNWTVYDMVLQAEDMYASWGLPRMTSKFWNYSIFEGNKNLTYCHGSAANLYRKDDYRMLLCAKVNMDDFYVITHEMGHIQYYMAYKDQIPIFQDGTNTAFHESIGDVTMHAILTPQHLNRLGLLNDDELNNSQIDMFLLLKQALTKIPEIPFALLIDTYRWNIFRNNIKPIDYNKIYWMLNEELRGIMPPFNRDDNQYFDAGGKFHIPDNTPYIRYFLSNILQMDIHKSFCQLTLYGKIDKNDTILKNIELHKCDLYGSKQIGKYLKKFMEKGASERWQNLKVLLTRSKSITVRPLLEYYRPVYKWLKKYIERNNVIVGW